MAGISKAERERRQASSAKFAEWARPLEERARTGALAGLTDDEVGALWQVLEPLAKFIGDDYGDALRGLSYMAQLEAHRRFDGDLFEAPHE
jgi:hypothetical protein